MKRRIIIIVAVVAVLGLAGTILYLFRPKQDCVCNERSSALINASDLYAAYETDEESANGKFTGKILTVNGTIETVTSDEAGNKIVEIQTNSTGIVSCSLCRKSSESFSSNPGDEITVKGECAGFTFDVILIRGCIEN